MAPKSPKSKTTVRAKKQGKTLLHDSNSGAEDLWIAPKSNLKGDNGDRAWNDRMATPTGSRLLELADIALGLKKPEAPKKRRAGSSGKA